jgi:hypothetical protein
MSDDYTSYNMEGSNFNEAVFQIQRLHACWMNCKQYRTKGDLFSWRWELETIWSELSTDARRLQKNETWEKNKHNVYVSGLDKLIGMSTKCGKAKTLYDLLDKKEKYLRYLQNLSGKGGSYDEGRKGLN